MSMIDMLFTCLLGMMVMLFIAMMLMAEQSKTGDIPAHAEFLISLEWDPKSGNDIDLWLKLPDGKKIFFRSKSHAGAFLDRDDIGSNNDFFYIENNEMRRVEINREVIAIRGIFPGTYTVNLHAYRLGGQDNSPIEKTKVILNKINPISQILAQKEIVLDKNGQEVTAFTFTVDSKGNVTDINTYFVPMVYDP